MPCNRYGHAPAVNGLMEVLVFVLAEVRGTDQ